MSSFTMILPEWQTCLAAMRDKGLDYGSEFEASWVAKQLKLKEGTVQFGFAVANIANALTKEGKHLYRRGPKFYVLEANKNHLIVQKRRSKAVDHLVKGIILSSTTDKQRLTEEERRELDRQEQLTARQISEIKKIEFRQGLS